MYTLTKIVVLFLFIFCITQLGYTQENIKGLDNYKDITTRSRYTNGLAIQEETPKTKKIKKIADTELKKCPDNLDKDLQQVMAPGNDAICSATTIPAPLSATCVTGQTNIGSTSDYYGGCVFSTDKSVWYTFTLTGSNNQIDITFAVPGSLGGTALGQGGSIYLFLATGPCTSPTGVMTICALPSTTFTFDNLTVGGTYYLLVATMGSKTGNFNICATQSVMPTGNQTGSEQDCLGALPLCENPKVFPGSYLGHGTTQEISTGCLLGGETNSMWYVFTAQTTGKFDFNIVTVKDYDWALYNITSIGCAGIPAATPVRCNWSATAGNTGLTTTYSTELPAISVSAGGLPTENGISDMTAGNTYALIIDNWSSDNNGFTINLGTGGGYADILDVTKPTMTSATASCTANTILVTMSEQIKCLSVNQTDFTLTNTTTSTPFTGAILSIVGYNCPATNGAMTNQILITHDGTLTSGSYSLTINASPALVDKCGNPILAGGSVAFGYLKSITLTPSTSNICYGGSVTLTAAQGVPTLAPYNLNPGGFTNSIDGIFSGLTPTSTTIYIVSETYGGCTKTASTTINVEGNIITSISPAFKSLCGAGTTTITATTTINGANCAGCTYVWSATPPGTNPSGIVSAGVYTVTATSPTGCHNSNSPSSTIVVASSGGGGGTCDVLYVSNEGIVRDGATKTTPTTLADAINKATCTNTIIKMKVGIYDYDFFHPIHSFVTIEGGYNDGFTTKTSDMTGGTSSTTIRRSKTTGDTDDNTKCSAFVADANADAFRIQDIRIELPGSASVSGHAAGANKTNYGIRLGTACTNYNIVRCYIDAGVGSAP